MSVIYDIQLFLHCAAVHTRKPIGSDNLQTLDVTVKVLSLLLQKIMIRIEMDRMFHTMDVEMVVTLA